MITEKTKADKVYFILFGKIKLKEASKEQYYGICKVGWPIGEEVLLNNSTSYIDTAQAGNDIGIIHITLDELAQIKDKTDPADWTRFIKRLKKFAFLKKVMRKINLIDNDYHF